MRVIVTTIVVVIAIAFYAGRQPNTNGSLSAAAELENDRANARVLREHERLDALAATATATADAMRATTSDFPVNLKPGASTTQPVSAERRRRHASAAVVARLRRTTGGDEGRPGIGIPRGGGDGGVAAAVRR